MTAQEAPRPIPTGKGAPLVGSMFDFAGRPQ